MKNRIKILLSFMFLVSMFLIFQGCQKETFSEPQNDSKYVTRKVTFDDIKNKPELSKPFKLLKNVLDFNAKNKSLPDSFVIETDQIIEVIAGNKISYSFKILNPIDLTSVFENFIIDVSDPQNTKYFIFQYKYKETFEKGEFPFDVIALNLSEYQIEINDFHINLTKNDPIIICVEIAVSPRDFEPKVMDWWVCGGGGNDDSDNSDSDTSTGTDSNSESGDYHDNTGSGGTNSNTSGSTSGSDDYVDPDGHAGVNFSEIEYVESILTNLTDEQIAFLYNPNNDYEVSMIAAFLTDNKTTEAMSFAVLAVETYLDQSEFNLNDFVAFQQFIPQYREQMSQDEIIIFDNMALRFRDRYLFNAYVASIKAKNLFPDTYGFHNDKSDAFRHAYFHGLNTIYIGYNLSLQLGTAHENSTPQNLILEKNMDLYNNEIGRQNTNPPILMNKLGTLQVRIINAINNGELLHLFPIDAPFGTINSNTQLLQSNQP